MKRYYIQRHASRLCGNCLIWWRKGGAGYTCDLDDAEVFDGDSREFRSIMANSPEKYTAWDKDYIDAVAVRHANNERLNHDMKGMKP